MSLSFEDVEFEMSHLGDNMVIGSIIKLGRSLKTSRFNQSSNV